MGNCIGHNNYNLTKKDRAKRKSEDFRIELDMCEKKYASEMNRLMILDFELQNSKAENERLREEMHRLVQEQARVTRTIKTQQLKSSVRLANLKEHHRQALEKMKQSEADYENVEHKLKIMTKLCDKNALKRQDSIIYMRPQIGTRPASANLDQTSPKIQAMKPSVSSCI